MWLKLRFDDLRLIIHYVGMFIVGMGLIMVVPFLTGVLYGEYDAALDFLAGMGVVCAVGTLLVNVHTRPENVNHMHALAITALGWLAASMAAAVPLAFSANYATYLDALFDALSGLTTSGLTVVVDLDHMANAHNMWRHLTHLIGGQGIIVAALSLAVGLRGGAFSLYLAEGRDERILPNVIHTVRFIWYVTAVYVALGTIALFGVTLYLGMAPARGILHAFWIAVAAYDTGGFGPQSLNAMYYHSFLFEVVSVFLMVAGTLNFNLHAHVWKGNRSELWRNLEVRVLAFNILALSVLTAIGLSATRAFNGPFAAVRKGAYHILSAHTGTGHQTIFSSQWLTDFGGPAFVAVLIAMAAGGAVSSTAGGIKALRLGLIVRSVIQQVKEALAPKSAFMRARYHHMGERFLTPEIGAAAAAVFILYIFTYVTGALIGAAYGHDAGSALFESISATANVGLSTGITSASMPTGLKIVYIVQMWAGRLEFIAVLVLVAQLILAVRPQRGRRAA
ncbi:MAG: TrkH family potassium uptake protein [Anaerosomatales bacterium]